MSLDTTDDLAQLEERLQQARQAHYDQDARTPTHTTRVRRPNSARAAVVSGVAQLLSEELGLPHGTVATVIVAYRGDDAKAEKYIRERLAAGVDILPVDVDGSIARAKQVADEDARPLDEVEAQVAQLVDAVGAARVEVASCKAALSTAEKALDEQIAQLANAKAIIARRTTKVDHRQIRIRADLVAEKTGCSPDVALAVAREVEDWRKAVIYTLNQLNSNRPVLPVDQDALSRVV